MSTNATVAPSASSFFVEGDLQKYADQSRKENRFVDVCIKSGDASFQAHCLVLAYYSQFFERLFLTPMREQYQRTVELNELDEGSVKIIVDFMYTRNIIIDYENVFNLLATAHFLQINEVCEFCFDYLKTAITVDNWPVVLSTCYLYENNLLLQELYQFICGNLDVIAQSEEFKELSIKQLNSITKTINKTNVTETSLYNAMVSWVHHDESNRKSEFPNLLLLVDLNKLPCDFLEDIAFDPLVTENLVCLNAVTCIISKKLQKLRLRECGSKLLSIGGPWSKVVEVFNLLEKSNSVYPDLPQQLHYFKALEMNKCIYSIGGCLNCSLNQATNRVYCMKENELHWHEIAPMNEERSCMGAAVFKDCLVVAGGVGILENRICSSEWYIPALNRWLCSSDLHYLRSASELVACNGYVYSIGGYDGVHTLSSVERLKDFGGEWEEIEPMQHPRSQFATVTYNGEIYVIGGRYTNDIGETIRLKAVEKYSPTARKWTSVSDMNYQRYGLAACLLDRKIYVVGGGNADGQTLKSIECYNPSTNMWSIVGNVNDEFLRHSLVAL